MICLTFRLLYCVCIGIKVNSIGNAQTLTFWYIPQPLIIVLVCLIHSIPTPDNSKINPWYFHHLPVNLSLMLTDIYPLFHCSRNRIPQIIDKHAVDFIPGIWIWFWSSAERLSGIDRCTVFVTPAVLCSLSFLLFRFWLVTVYEYRQCSRHQTDSQKYRENFLCRS